MDIYAELTKAFTPPSQSEDDATAPGWRQVDPDEIIAKGDEYWCLATGTWETSGMAGMLMPLPAKGKAPATYRRRI
jgi:hypothetical protein